ncbi:Peptidase A1 domain-containing protein [Mycena kentingensis (nom. inval.)]|nr:Peptidase A1 domain-containing protein [Mycena kentingensis (nom. inval.)]
MATTTLLHRTPSIPRLPTPQHIIPQRRPRSPDDIIVIDDDDDDPAALRPLPPPAQRRRMTPFPEIIEIFDSDDDDDSGPGPSNRNGRFAGGSQSTSSSSERAHSDGNSRLFSLSPPPLDAHIPPVPRLPAQFAALASLPISRSHPPRPPVVSNQGSSRVPAPIRAASSDLLGISIGRDSSPIIIDDDDDDDIIRPAPRARHNPPMGFGGALISTNNARVAAQRQERQRRLERSTAGSRVAPLVAGGSRVRPSNDHNGFLSRLRRLAAPWRPHVIEGEDPLNQIDFLALAAPPNEDDEQTRADADFALDLFLRDHEQQMGLSRIFRFGGAQTQWGGLFGREPDAPAEDAYKQEYTHPPRAEGGFVFDFEPSQIVPAPASGKGKGKEVVIDVDEADKNRVDALLVCAHCFDPLFLRSNVEGGEEEEKRRRLWGLRCGHVFDGKCLEKLWQPADEAAAVSSQVHQTKVVGKGKAKGAPPPVLDEDAEEQQERDPDSSSSDSESDGAQDLLPPPIRRRLRSSHLRRAHQPVEEELREGVDEARGNVEVELVALHASRRLRRGTSGHVLSPIAGECIAFATMPARVIDVERGVNDIFNAVQRTSYQTKNFAAARQLHCRNLGNDPGDKYANKFETAFWGATLRALPLKKGVPAGDRAIRFVAHYFTYLQDHDVDEAEDSDDEDVTTLASRFLTRMMERLLPGVSAKDKVVRYRVVELITEIAGEMPMFDEITYQALRSALLERMADKEVTIRVQAAVALCRFSNCEDPAKLVDDQELLTHILMDRLARDDAADVRKSILRNITLTAEVKDALISRTRDSDPAVRRVAYTDVFTKLLPSSEVLSVQDRETIVSNGLGDRDSTIRGYAATMVQTWFANIDAAEEITAKMEDVDISNPNDTEKVAAVEESRQLLAKLDKFLMLFDLTAETTQHGETHRGKAAADALKTLFAPKMNIEEKINFAVIGDYFTSLTPRRIFLARVFLDHLADNGREVPDTCTIPPVTACAYHIQEWMNVLFEQRVASSEHELIVRELLKFALNLDYGDETGRRNMVVLMKKGVENPSLPLELLPQCLDVMRKLHSERDLLRIIVEVVNDLRDDEVEEEEDEDGNQSLDSIDPSQQPTPRKKPARQDLPPEQRRIADERDLRCLRLCIALLERLDGTFEQNSMLEGVFADLIAPSVWSENPAIQEASLTAFGLSLIVARDRAARSILHLFGRVNQAASLASQIAIYKAGCDLLLAHWNYFSADVNKTCLEFLLKQFDLQMEQKEKASAELSAVLSLGLAKLVLHSLIDDPKPVMTRLVLAYYSPYNRDNQELLQASTYFLNMFGRSSVAHQKVMVKIFPQVFKETAEMYLKYEADADDPASLDLANLIGLWVECTDPAQVLDPNDEAGQSGDPMTQFMLAEEVLRFMLNEKNMPKEQRKLLCQMLDKLYLPKDVDDADRVRTLRLLVNNVNRRRPVKDMISNNAMKRLDAKISKQYADHIEGFDEDAYREMEQHRALFEFLDEIFSDDEEEAPKKKTRKRRSKSVATTDDDNVSVASSKARGKSKPKAKRRRLSTSDDDSDEDDNVTAKGTPPPAPNRQLRARAPAKTIKKPVIAISDSEEESDEEVPRPPRKRATTRKQEAQIIADIEEIIDRETPVEVEPDSIFVDDSDEEEEVSGQLLMGL